MLLTKRKSTFNCIYVNIISGRERGRHGINKAAKYEKFTYILPLPTGFSSGGQKAENFPHLIMKINNLPH